MINYFNFRKFRDKNLITNDIGAYAFLSDESLQQMIEGKMDPNSDLFRQLEKDGFVYRGSKQSYLTTCKERIRSGKSYLFNCTTLHIFVLTTNCNLQCVYCQARSANEISHGMMSAETAEKAVDFALQAPDNYLTFEFQGGEPLLNFSVMKHIVEYAEKHKGRKHIEYSLVSNLVLMTDEISDFIKKYGISVSSSLDGNAGVHDVNRPFSNGAPSYKHVVDKISELRSIGIVPGAIETTTRWSLQYPEEIVDSYVNNGFDSIFLRPLTPLGYAAANWEEIGYEPEEFIQFYRRALAHILKINRDGRYLAERHAAVFLRKIMQLGSENYMELRSPCGGVIGQIAYFHNGEIYTCDEGRMLGEMGDDSFRLGSVYETSFDKVICSGKCKALMSSSLLESVPECCDCVYQPYCGVCPVLNLAMYGDIYPLSPNHYKCRIYRGILDSLFEYLYENDETIIDIFRSWIE